MPHLYELLTGRTFKRSLSNKLARWRGTLEVEVFGLEITSRYLRLKHSDRAKVVCHAE